MKVLKAIFCLKVQLICLLTAAIFTSCFTGVEGTSKITLSKKDIIATSPSSEDIFLADVAPEILKDWKKGKRFVVADDKFRLIIENAGSRPVKEGDIIEFNGLHSGLGVDNKENTNIRFQNGADEINYVLERELNNALETVTASDVPMLIELDLVEKVNQKLRGKKIWTKTALWYNERMEYKKGKKFCEVEITGVSPGNSFFPLKVSFVDNEGNTGVLLMNFGNSGNESRNFGKLFSLTDPRNSYKSISPDVWEAIQNENVMTGMTKEECRLSIGTPSDVEMGHSYSSAMEIWFYPDGSYLRFIDGILVNFKK